MMTITERKRLRRIEGCLSVALFCNGGCTPSSHLRPAKLWFRDSYQFHKRNPVSRMQSSSSSADVRQHTESKLLLLVRFAKACHNASLLSNRLTKQTRSQRHSSCISSVVPLANRRAQIGGYEGPPLAICA